MPDEYLDQLRPEDRAPRYTFDSPDPLKPWTIVTIEARTIRGFATAAPAPDPELSDHGELCALYVGPARARLAELRFRKAILWALAGNVRAERFYVKDGWAHDSVRGTKLVWGAECEEIRYQSSFEAR